MQLEDGTGSAYVTKVTAENRLATDAVIATLEHHYNHGHGNAYNVLFSQTPSGVDDCIFYMKNGSETDITIEGIMLGLTAACTIRVEVENDGSPTTPTDLTPANLNQGSGKLASGTFQTGASLALGSGTVIERYYFPEPRSSSYINFEQDLILPKNRIMTIWCLISDASGSVPTIYGTVIFNYHEVEGF